MSIRYWPCHLLFAACSLAQSTTPLENDYVKVIQAYEKPRVQTPMHEHKLNRVIIYEQAGTQEFIDLHRKPYVINFKAGDVRWTRAGGMHMAQIYSDLPVTMVEIEIKKPGNPSLLVPGPLDSTKADPKHHKVEIENDQVRVLRVTLGPHESTPLHEYLVNQVVTYLTNQDLQITYNGGKVEHAAHKAGEISWTSPAALKLENLGDKPAEMIVTELKCN